MSTVQLTGRVAVITGASANRTAGRGFASMQDQYNLLQRSAEEMVPLLADQGVGSIP
jgi:aryl-alcohol dehydrogenase-like predicted oxidoreductase